MRPTSEDERARWLYVTAPDRAVALDLARDLVGARLAACANVSTGVTSVYRWQGRVEQDDECVLVLKTTAARVEDATRRLVERHPYECPCVVALPIEAGHGPFLAWIRDEVAPEGRT